MPPRVASLLPSTTEILCAMGGFELLCGVSHECDWPAEVAAAVQQGRLPQLTSSRLSAPGPLQQGEAGSGLSRQIDDDLRELVRQSLAVYQVDDEALAAAKPDIVLTQDLCEVCAVSYEETCRAVGMLRGGNVEIVSTHPRCLDDIWRDILRIGHAVGMASQAEKLLLDLAARVDAVRWRAEKAVASWRDGMAPRVVTLEWIDPPMPGGLWMPEMVELAGGEPLLLMEEGQSHVLSAERLEQLCPEILVVHPCGMDLGQGIKELKALRRALPWEDWPACMGGQVYLCDGSAYFNRPGPRIVDTLELLAACIQPIDFPHFRHKYRASAVTVGPDLELELWPNLELLG